MGACFAKKERGQAKGWNCSEWAHATPDIKHLPEKKTDSSPAETKKEGAARKAAVVAELEKQASTLPQLLGVRAGALILGVRPPV
jgi:Tfp pilus assembly protein FimV